MRLDTKAAVVRDNLGTIVASIPVGFDHTPGALSDRANSIGTQIVEALNTHADLKAKCDAMEDALRELCDAGGEIVDLMEDVRNGDYTPDTFTVQPMTIALAKAQAFTAMESEQPTGEGVE